MRPRPRFILSRRGRKLWERAEARAYKRRGGDAADAGRGRQADRSTRPAKQDEKKAFDREGKSRRPLVKWTTQVSVARARVLNHPGKSSPHRPPRAGKRRPRVRKDAGWIRP